MVCGQLVAPPNGLVVVNGVEPGDEAFYSCNNEHSLVSGDSRRVCLQTGIWSGTKPDCKLVPTTEPPAG